jgi:hypothetical protein
MQILARIPSQQSKLAGTLEVMYKRAASSIKTCTEQLGPTVNVNLITAVSHPPPGASLSQERALESMVCS